MGLFDRFKKTGDQAESLVETQGDKIADGVDKATDLVDDKTQGKHSDKLEQVDDMADKLRDDDSSETAES